jgi:beta-glucosidase
MTHNEPYCAAMFGYRDGVQAPGLKEPAAALAAAHHLLLSHGFAVRVIRSQVPGAKVGIVLNLSPVVSASSSDADREACRERDGDANRWYLDPLYGRGYPTDVIRDLHAAGVLAEASLPFVQPGDLDTIAEPTDFLGINYYTRSVARSKRVAEKDNAPVSVTPNPERTAMGWEVYPEGLEEILVQVHERYAPRAIYVAENGAAFDDPRPDKENRVSDSARREFLTGHLAAAERAIRAGVPLHGYFQWSLLDNFEWAHGYRKRFGLFYVDYETQRRFPKDSAFWYKQAIALGKLPEGAQ